MERQTTISFKVLNRITRGSRAVSNNYYYDSKIVQIGSLCRTMRVISYFFVTIVFFISKFLFCFENLQIKSKVNLHVTVIYKKTESRRQNKKTPTKHTHTNTHTHKHTYIHKKENTIQFLRPTSLNTILNT